MNFDQKAAETAEKECDAQVRERLSKGLWVSAKEWIAMRDKERQKALDDAKILASFW